MQEVVCLEHSDLISNRVSDLSTAGVADIYSRIRHDSLEMSRLKSDVDIDCFTLGSQGDFPCHKYHFLMRQYSLASLELRRLVNDRERLRKKMKHLDGLEDDPAKDFYIDVELEACRIDIDGLELSIRNKLSMCEEFESRRVVLVQEHGNLPFTDEEYQKEDPLFWRWYFDQMIHRYGLQGVTHVPEGVYQSVMQLEKEHKHLAVAHNFPQLIDVS